LPRGQVLLAPPGQLEQQQGDPLLGDVVVPISLQNDLVWLPVALQGANPQAAGEPLKRAMAIGSSRYDSVLDRRLCNSLRRPAGNVGPVLCESIDFSPYVAFRPDEVVQVHPDGVAGVMGINLLERFRIHVDRQSLLATLRSTASPVFPQQDLAWFQAMVAEDRDLVLNWLEQHGDSRLGREAAEFLLNLLLV